MKNTFFLAALVFCTNVNAASYMDEYREYTKALNAGDYENTVKYARSAWKAAETELGEHKTTGMLAYNFALQIYESQPSEAIPALQSTIKYIDATSNEFEHAPPKLLLAYSNFLLTSEKNSAKQLAKLLQKRIENNDPVIEVEANSNYLITHHYWEKRKYATAIKHSERSILALEKFQPELNRSHAKYYFVAGLALVRATQKRSDLDAIKAIGHLSKSISLYPPQKNLDSIDPVLTKTLAWREAIDALGWSDRRQTNSFQGRRMQLLPNKYTTPEYSFGVKWQDPRPSPEECNLSLVAGDDTRISQRGRERTRFGAVVVGFDIAADGSTENIRLLAEVPNKTIFSKNTLKAIKSWKFAKGFNSGEACAKDHIHIFKYIVS